MSSENEGGPVALACAEPQGDIAKTERNDTAIGAEPQPVELWLSFSSMIVAFAGRCAVRVVDPSGEDLADLCHALVSAADELGLGDREWSALLRAAAREHERRFAA